MTAPLRRELIREVHIAMSTTTTPTSTHLQCMEIWGGIEPVERTVSTPGLDLWVFSRPFHGDEQGGDVYYVTLCGGGVITRIVVADVSGHGSSVAEFSPSLRSLLRKNINQKSQKRLVERLNRQFAEMAGMQRFATALVITYLASRRSAVRLQRGPSAAALLSRRARRPGRSFRNRIAITKSAATCHWVSTKRPATRRLTSTLGRGDLLAFYTDALSEAADPAGKLLGEDGTARGGPRLDLSRFQPGDDRLGTFGGRRPGIADIAPPMMTSLSSSSTTTPRATPRLSSRRRRSTFMPRSLVSKSSDAASGAATWLGIGGTSPSGSAID